MTHIRPTRKKINKHEAEIDWAQSAIDIERKLRAFIPWPGCQTHHDTTRLRVSQASVIAKESNAHAGRIVNLDDQGVYVACGKQTLRLEALQRDGSRALAFKEFRNGYELKLNDQLG